MTLHVVDATALLCIEDVVEPGDYQVTLDDLTDCVEAGTLTFPNEVVLDLERRARGEPLFTWIKAVAPSRAHRAVAFKHTQWVLGQHRALHDPDSAVDSPTAVAAMVRSLVVSGVAHHLVTEDVGSKPNRATLRNAASAVGWKCAGIRDGLACMGLAHRLA
jgi:hypothetical protein